MDSELGAVPPTRSARADGRGPRLVMALAAVYLIWSSTYLGMKVVLLTFGPMTLGAMRFLAAGSVLFIAYLVRGGKRPTRAQVVAAIPTGLLMFLAGNGFVAIAQHGVTSGVASIVASTTPLWAALIGMFLGERARAGEWWGLALGLMGVGILGAHAELGGEPLMVATLLLAPVGWALGTVLARRLPQAPGLGAPALQMLAGGLGMALAAALAGERWPDQISGQTWSIFAYLVVAGSLIGFTAFTWLLMHTRPSLALSYSYVNPLIAVMLGGVLAGEPIHGSTVVATLVLGAAVALVVRSAVARRRG